MRRWLVRGSVVALAVGPVGAVVFAANPAGLSGSDPVVLIAGSSTSLVGFSGDGGPATSARLGSGTGVAVDARGDVYIADTGNNRVREVTPCGTISTIAGSGAHVQGSLLQAPGGFSGDGGPATKALLNAPKGVAVDAHGNVFIADTGNRRVRKVSPNGTITTVAGTGLTQLGIDAHGVPLVGDGGPAISAALRAAYGIAVDGQGDLYIADHDRVRKVSANGTITTVAGTGVPGESGDGGPATQAEVEADGGLALDRRGNLYLADASTNRVRKVSPNGTITTIAGPASTGDPVDVGVGFSGDGGPATKARLADATSVAVDAQGNVYVADSENQRVRKVSPGGTITTVAGNGDLETGAQVNIPRIGAPASTVAMHPFGLAADAQGNLYIATLFQVLEVSRRPLAAAGPRLLGIGVRSGQRLLTGRGITVSAGCDRPSKLTARGSVKIPGTHKVIALAPASATLKAAGSATLTLAVPSAEKARLESLLSSNRRAQVMITVRAVDRAGHVCTSKRVVTVRR